jgi:hypothetical protein
MSSAIMPKSQQQTFETNLHRKNQRWQISFTFAVRLSRYKTDNNKKAPNHLEAFNFYTTTYLVESVTVFCAGAC